MNKFALIVLGIILISAGYLFVSNQNSEDNSATNGGQETLTSKDDKMDITVEHDGGVMADDDSKMVDGEATAKDGDAMVEDGSAIEEMVIELDGFKFGFSNEEIRVKKGSKVTIKFTSTDGFHDWVVDEFNAATERVNTGGSSSVTFVADQAGTFEYYCSVGSHRQLGMVGNIIVE